MIFHSKRFGSQKQDTQTQTHRHTKTKERPVPVYLGMKPHCCCTLHLAAQSIWKKGGQKWDIWRLVQETSGAAKVSILELCAGVGAEHSSVHSIHPNCILQPVHTDTDKAVTMLLLLLFGPWWHQLRQMVISVPLWHMCQLGGTHQCIKPFAMVDLLCIKRVVLSQP